MTEAIGIRLDDETLTKVDSISKGRRRQKHSDKKTDNQRL